VTKNETVKLNEIARLAKKYMRAYNDSVEQLEQLKDPKKEHLLYYHKGMRDCYDGLLRRMREDNLIQ
jgi:hypothetical protein